MRIFKLQKVSEVDRDLVWICDRDIQQKQKKTGFPLTTYGNDRL